MKEHRIMRTSDSQKIEQASNDLVQLLKDNDYKPQGQFNVAPDNSFVHQDFIKGAVGICIDTRLRGSKTELAYTVGLAHSSRIIPECELTGKTLEEIYALEEKHEAEYESGLQEAPAEMRDIEAKIRGFARQFRPGRFRLPQVLRWIR